VKIAIDLRPLQIGHQYRGIGAYLMNVLERFPLDTTEHSFIIVRYDTSNPVEDFGLPFKDYKEVLVKRPKEVHGTAQLLQLIKRPFRRQFGNLRRHRPDIFFQPDFMLGLPRGGLLMKKYVVMYDLIPLVLKEMYLPSWQRLLTRPGLGKTHRLYVVGAAWVKEYYYRYSLRGLRRAHHIFSISRATSEDLHTRLGISKKKIRTIPLAPSVPDIQASPEYKPKQLTETKKPFLYFTGGVDERRRLTDLIHAFNLLNARGHTFDLVLSGKELFEATKIPNTAVREAVMDSSYKDQIHLLGFASQEEKAWLMEHAFAFVYPSIYEGFGMPVLEAMVQGCPAITYNNSSLPEIAGKAAILLEKQGGVAIRDAILALQKDPKAREELIAAGKKQAAKFSWDRCADETYKNLTNKR
jgi:glycosyltransferase involved in cell wall biosynthesis